MKYEDYLNEELEKRRLNLRADMNSCRTSGRRMEDEVRLINRELEGRKAAALKQETDVEVYRSFDCAGMSVGRYKFYFGYEKTACCNHGKADCSECIEDYWCFTAEVDGVEVMRIPEPRLGQDEVLMNLLHGIGQFVAKEL